MFIDVQTLKHREVGKKIILQKMGPFGGTMERNSGRPCLPSRNFFSFFKELDRGCGAVTMVQ